MFVPPANATGQGRGNPDDWSGWDCSVVAQCTNTTAQDIAYEALLGVFGTETWFGGVYVWLWRPDPMAGGTSDTDFTPQGKPALQTLRRHWQAEERPREQQQPQQEQEQDGRWKGHAAEAGVGDGHAPAVHVYDGGVLVSSSDPYHDRIKGVIVGSGEWSSPQSNRLDSVDAVTTLKRIAATGANFVQVRDGAGAVTRQCATRSGSRTCGLPR